MKIFLLLILIIIVIFLALAGYLLVSPLKLKIDSRAGYLSLGWNRWLNAKVTEDARNWCILLQVWFWKKRFLIEDLVFAPGKKKEKTEKTKSVQSKKARSRWPFIQKIFRAIKVTKFKWSLDTDDFILNAYLAPVFELLNLKSGYNTHINFIGRNEIILNAESRIINMLKAGIF